MEKCKDHRRVFQTACISCIEEIYHQGSESIKLLEELKEQYVVHLDNDLIVKLVVGTKVEDIWHRVETHLRDV